MEQKPNKLRAKLNAGQCVTGTVLYSWSPNVLDIAGFAGLDFIRLDLEHTYTPYTTMEHIMRAAYIADVVTLVRVDREESWILRKALEIGAGGIIVPDVESVEEVENIVAMSKFPPTGKRGYSGNVLAAGFTSRAGKKWIDYSNTEPMIGVMIENVHAMKDIDRICAVKGLDFVQVGPSDYSMSLGLGSPNWDNEQVIAGIEKTIATAKKNNVHVALGVKQDVDNILKWKNKGINMLEFTNDLGVLKSVWSKLNKAVLEH